MSVLPFFDPLDELIQVIYQGIERFTILSKLNDDDWTIHVGLEGEEGRWWRGRWEEDDAESALVSHLLETDLLTRPSHTIPFVV
jgi:hypothetical protein